MSFLFLLFFLFSSPLFSEIMHAPKDCYNAYEGPSTEHNLDADIYPFITELSYRKIADHAVDLYYPHIDLEKIQPGDMIYCGVPYLPWFFDEVHEKIPCPYVLLTCDFDSFQPKFPVKKALFDPKLVCWFSRNMLFTNHPKFVQIPMGQAWYIWRESFHESLDSFQYFVDHPAEEKDILLYLNFSERHMGRRFIVAEKFAHKSYCYSRNRPRKPSTFEEFWEEASRSKFILSPLGVEIDCTRTWEAFSLGAYPIVEHTFLDSLYEDLPVLLIDNWDEVTQESLEKKYAEMSSKNYQIEKTKIHYWERLIAEKKEEVRREGTSPGALEVTLFSAKELEGMRHILQQHRKEKDLLIYSGNMTCLAPFQVAKSFPDLKRVIVLDMWTREGYEWIKEFAKDPSLIDFRKVFMPHPRHSQKIYKIKEPKSIFLDLRYFRHKLFIHVKELPDFLHSLEKDVKKIYKRLIAGDVLFGNMAQDFYVARVLARLEETSKWKICYKEEFWWVVKK